MWIFKHLNTSDTAAKIFPTLLCCCHIRNSPERKISLCLWQTVLQHMFNWNCSNCFVSIRCCSASGSSGHSQLFFLTAVIKCVISLLPASGPHLSASNCHINVTFLSSVLMNTDALTDDGDEPTTEGSLNVPDTGMGVFTGQNIPLPLLVGISAWGWIT